VVDIKTFALNMYAIVGAVLALLALLILGVGAWTLLKVLIWRSRQDRAEARRKSERPPAAPGICQRCQRAADAVYHLPSGERLCAACYAQARVPDG
jgi:hypothetical protein